MDGEHRASAEPNVRGGLVFNRKPEVSDFVIGMMDNGLADPHRRALCGLSLDFGDREVGGIYPDLAAVEQFV